MEKSIQQGRFYRIFGRKFSEVFPTEDHSMDPSETLGRVLSNLFTINLANLRCDKYFHLSCEKRGSNKIKLNQQFCSVLQLKNYVIESHTNNLAKNHVQLLT